MDHLHVFTSRLGWFTSHTGESLLPAGPPLKAFIIHNKMTFCVHVFWFPEVLSFFHPPKKAKKPSFFFWGGGGYQSSCVCMLHPTGGKLWKRSAAAVFWDQWWCQNVRPDFLGTVGYASGASILAALLESYRGTVMLKDVGKFCCHAADKNLSFEVSKCAPEKTFRLSLRCKKRLALSCRTFYEFGVHWNGANTIFKSHKTMCFANPLAAFC